MASNKFGSLAEARAALIKHLKELNDEYEYDYFPTEEAPFLSTTGK